MACDPRSATPEHIPPKRRQDRRPRFVASFVCIAGLSRNGGGCAEGATSLSIRDKFRSLNCGSCPHSTHHGHWSSPSSLHCNISKSAPLSGREVLALYRTPPTRCIGAIAPGANVCFRRIADVSSLPGRGRSGSLANRTAPIVRSMRPTSVGYAARLGGNSSASSPLITFSNWKRLYGLLSTKW